MKPIDQLKDIAAHASEAIIKLSLINASFKAEAYAYHLGSLASAQEDGRDFERLELIRENCLNYIWNFDPHLVLRGGISAQAEVQRFVTARHIVKIIDGEDVVSVQKIIQALKNGKD